MLLVGHLFGRCWLEGYPACKKTEWWGAGVVVCLKRGADLHMAQLMPLPLTVSCFCIIQIGFTFLVLAHPGSPGKRAIKRVCVCVRNIFYRLSILYDRAVRDMFAKSRRAATWHERCSQFRFWQFGIFLRFCALYLILLCNYVNLSLKLLIFAVKLLSI